MKYLLDTDHISILQKQSGPEFVSLSSRMAREPLGNFAFSIISFHEQILGCQTYLARAKSTADVVRGYRLLDRILDAFSSSPVLPFDMVAGSVVENWKEKKVRVATMDLRIAAIANTKGLILLTRNARDFDKVPDVAHEDWSV